MKMKVEDSFFFLINLHNVFKFCYYFFNIVKI